MSWRPEFLAKYPRLCYNKTNRYFVCEMSKFGKLGDDIMTPEGFLFAFLAFIIFICIVVVVVVSGTIASIMGGIDDDDYMSTQNE